MMIGSLEITHELIFTIASVIQICTISSINSIQLRFNLGKPRINTCIRRDFNAALVESLIRDILVLHMLKELLLQVRAGLGLFFKASFKTLC